MNWFFLSLRNLISYLIPKDENLWVFGAYSGKLYIDNSKYLFKFTSTLPGTHAVWLTRSKRIYEKLRSDGYDCKYFLSLKGIWYSLRAKYVVLSYSYDDVSVFCYINCKDVIVIQLYHGTPLKNLDTPAPRSKFFQITRRTLVNYLGRKYDYVFCTSENSAEALNRHFRIAQPEKVFHISGYPRNDVLFRPVPSPYIKNIKAETSKKRSYFICQHTETIRLNQKTFLILLVLRKRYWKKFSMKMMRFF